MNDDFWTMLFEYGASALGWDFGYVGDGVYRVYVDDYEYGDYPVVLETNPAYEEDAYAKRWCFAVDVDGMSELTDGAEDLLKADVLARLRRAQTNGWPYLVGEPTAGEIVEAYTFALNRA